MSDTLQGPWRAWLDSPGGELAFGLRFERSGAGWTAEVTNGDERIHWSQVQVAGTEVDIAIPHYDAHIHAVLRGGLGGTRLEGSWVKQKRGKTDSLPLHAVPGDRPRYAAEPGGSAAVDGRWAVDFSSDDAPAVGILGADAGGRVQGTVQTVTGDYRYLDGAWQGDHLVLSTFDGSHAFLFQARVAPNGSLAGDFWSGGTWHETFTAVRDDDAALPDDFEATRWRGLDLASVTLPDLEGTVRRLDDPAFGAQVRLITLFGSWCPNCHDEARLLVRLAERFGDDLAILGIAFEHGDDAQRNIRQIRRYQARTGAHWPVLLGGSSAKDEASTSVPLVDRIRAYPTTIFLSGQDNRVHAVHTGFSGPATGPAHDRLARRYAQTIEAMIAGAP